MTLKQIFVGNLKNARRAAGLSQLRLAERCNTATNYISDIEVGKKFPSIDMVEKIAGALQVQPYLLFLDSGQLWLKPRKTGLSAVDQLDILRQANKSLTKILKRF
jgi:transcriptional regulator with XRE-family HTH domain